MSAVADLALTMVSTPHFSAMEQDASGLYMASH
jgi:hypothetical protein